MSGLAPVSGMSDDVAACQLIQSEFSYNPTITKCRRLGKVMPGKTQPLLITFGSEEQADSLMSKAKSLRQSKDAVIRKNVYLNRDMTKAQATAEFQVRCRRRADRLARSSGVVTTVTPHPSTSAGQQSSTLLPVPATAASAGLSAQSVPFVPSRLPAMSGIQPISNVSLSAQPGSCS